MTPRESATGKPFVALISATPVAEPPVRDAFARRFPDAALWGILDDRLLEEAGARGSVTPELQARMLRLIDHAALEDADGILLTCSVYGFLAPQAAALLGRPVFGPDDAMFAALIESGLHRVYLVASVALTMEDSADRLRRAAESAGVRLELIPVLATGARAAGAAGDVDALARSIVDAVAASEPGGQAVLLAQYSLAPAAEQIERALGLPTFSGPDRAADAMRRALGADA